jgi:tetratricopeptide (TPR) repeat protein
VAYGPDGRTILTGDAQTVRVWGAPAPLPDDLPRLAAWVAVATGLELDERGSARFRDVDGWLAQRRLLGSLGGPPAADPALRLDPTLFGDEPTARGDALAEQGLCDRAEAAYAEAARARPHNGPVRDARVCLQAGRGHLERAAEILAESVRLRPDDVRLRRQLATVLLASGDRAGWRQACTALFHRFGGTTNPSKADQVAWTCALGPEATADPGAPARLVVAAAEAPARLVETAVKDPRGESRKPHFLKTLGAALYRAGRYDEATRRLEESIQGQGGASLPEEWAFLAMAHHRLGHRDEASRWLGKLREYQPSENLDRFWDELTTRLLRSEAEAVILYDPVFPNDPFAR